MDDERKEPEKRTRSHLDGNDQPSPLIISAEKTLENLKRASTSNGAKPDNELDDDEIDLKTPPPAVHHKRRMSSIVPQQITDDIEKAYEESKLKGKSHEVEDDASPETSKARYSVGQASMINAVLGIGERDKSKDYESDHSRIGTLAGLGDVTDDDADLRENPSSKSDDSDTSAPREEVRDKKIVGTQRTADFEEILQDKEKCEKAKTKASKKSGNFWQNLFGMGRKTSNKKEES